MIIKEISRVSEAIRHEMMNCLVNSPVEYEELKKTARGVRCVMPPFFLCYEADTMIGFLSLSQVEETDCYGQIFLHPGIAKEQLEIMLRLLSEELAEYEFQRLYVVGPSSSNESLTPYLQSNGEDYIMKTNDFSEEIRKQGRQIAEAEGLQLRRYTGNDQKFYLKLLFEVFQMGSNESLSRVHEIESEDGMSAFVLTDHKGQAIGLTGCYEGHVRITLFDVAIEKKYQGRGYGKAMLSLVYDQLKSLKKGYLLQVNSASVAAIALYQALGFTITETVKETYLMLSQH